MQHLLCLFLICLDSLHIHAQKKQEDPFILNGKVTDPKNPVIYLIYDIDRKRTTEGI